MKTIGFVDYYISEWHANNYPIWIKETCEKLGIEEYKVQYAWAELDKSPLDGVTTSEWCEKYGVEKCDTIEELCEKADYILVLAPSDPEKHLGYAKEVLKYKKRTYIDKTFAPDYATAKEIFDIGEKYGTPFFSSSALRYATELDQMKDTVSIIVSGGGGNMPEYIIHQIEMAVKLLKAKALKLKVDKVGSNQYVTQTEFSDGKKSTFTYSVAMPFTIACQDKDGLSRYARMTSDYFKLLMEDILNFYKTGEKSFDGKETLEVMKVREGVIKGMSKCGEWIEL